MKKTNIIIGGDLCPTGKNSTYFFKKNVSKIFGETLSEFQQADLSIINLECPAIDSGKPIDKVGPSLYAKGNSISTLKKAGINMIGLANNHIMDYGNRGLMNTIQLCDENRLQIVGAGRNIQESNEIKIVKVNNIRIGVIAVAEHEFSIATQNRCGANPFNLISFVRNINKYKDNFDYLIVLYHGGNIQYPYPSPRLKETCEFMIEIGANAVVVQHTHCTGCYSKYQKGHIVYGQGNLLFDLPNRDKSFYEGMLVKLTIDDSGADHISFIPFEQSYNSPGIHLLSGTNKEVFFSTLCKRSENLQDNQFINSQWLSYCTKRRLGYLDRIYGINLLCRHLIFKKLFSRFFLSNKSLLRLQNTISCESHRDTILTILDNKLI